MGSSEDRSGDEKGDGDGNGNGDGSRELFFVRIRGWLSRRGVCHRGICLGVELIEGLGLGDFVKGDCEVS